MKKQIILTMCAAAALSSCHIYKAYDRPDTIDASGIYRGAVATFIKLTTVLTLLMLPVFIEILLRLMIRWYLIQPIWVTCLGKKCLRMQNFRH